MKNLEELLEIHEEYIIKLERLILKSRISDQITKLEELAVEYSERIDFLEVEE